MTCVRAVLHDGYAEVPEIQSGEFRVVRLYEIRVEPVCFFNVTPQAIEACELVVGEVVEKPYAKVVEPYFRLLG